MSQLAFVTTSFYLTLTVPYMQVLNVSLSEGEMVTLEDLGCREPLVLANESILMKGLVVRSQSNHIAVRFRSEQRPQPGSFLLRYQGKAVPSVQTHGLHC